MKKARPYIGCAFLLMANLKIYLRAK